MQSNDTCRITELKFKKKKKGSYIYAVNELNNLISKVKRKQKTKQRTIKGEYSIEVYKQFLSQFLTVTLLNKHYLFLLY